MGGAAGFFLELMLLVGFKYKLNMHLPGVSGVECQEAQEASNSTSCQSKPQWGWQREDNNYSANNIATSVSIIAQW